MVPPRVPKGTFAMLLPRRILFALLFAIMAGLSLSVQRDTIRAESGVSFAGQLLVASPKIGDPRFRKSVIYMVEHSANGAIGIIVNKLYGTGPLANLMTGFGMDPGDAKGSIDLHFGGPVAKRGAFILHTSDYTHAESRSIDGTVSFTTDTKILRAYAAGKGPKRLLFALGYAGWSPGQLENEIERGDWSIAKPSEGLVFGDGKGDAWERVVESSELPL